MNLSARLRLRELAARSGRVVELGEVAEKTNPDLWRAKVAAAKRKFGKWSARASQWAVREYKEAGGGYRGKKSSSNSMAKWTRQKWRTRDGDKAERRDSRGRKVVARYLPDAKWKSLTPGEAAATDAKKRRASRKGKQVVANTEKAKVRGLAACSGRLVELARVQSVTGQILNIKPVPRSVADPILRAMRRKLEKGGDRMAVRAAFLGPVGPRMRRAKRIARSGQPLIQRHRGTELWRPRVVDIDGKKSLLHYRIARSEAGLRAPLEPVQRLAEEESMRRHVTTPGSAISTSTERQKAMRFISSGGNAPVEGIYATPLDELVRNQREKTKAAMINSSFTSEREITQTHGKNLFKVRKHKATIDPKDRDNVVYQRSRAARSGRLVEFSVAWARRLKNLSPEAVRRLRDGLREQTRQTGGKLGRGADFRVYESFTPGRGRTATKTLVPDALKGRDEVVASAKKAWADVEASPAGRQSALPVKWHDSGYVQDRMISPDIKPVGSRFAQKISSGFKRTRRAKGVPDFEDVFAMPKGANDSSLIIQRHTSSSRTPGKSNILAHNILLDPRKRRLVLTDPIGWQSSSTQIGALTPGPAVR